jgi:cytochrome d ubiquinol oxidase subunit II
MLRGAAFVFRAHGHDHAAEGNGKKPVWFTDPFLWQIVFGISSIISPFLLGAAFGAITEGGVRVGSDGSVSADPRYPIPWLSAYSIGCGLLALSSCSYLAAVYLVTDTTGDLREDFRRRAIVSGTTTACLAIIVLLLARAQSPWFYAQLTARRSQPVLAAGLIFFAASAWAVFARRYRLAPIFAAGELVLVLAGWGLAHEPYLIYPDMTLERASAPDATLRFLLRASVVGLLLLLPSLWLLFRVFKQETFASSSGKEMQ